MYTNIKHCFHSCHQCDNIDGLNKYKQQTMNNLQLYSCSRSQHAHAIRVNWLNIITKSIIYDFYYLVTVKQITPLHSTELFKIFFSLLTLNNFLQLFLQKASGHGQEKNLITFL